MHKYKKTKRFHAIECSEGYYILYNTVLNKPALLTLEAYRFFEKNEYIDEVKLVDNMLRDVLLELIDSFLYIPYGFDEYELCKEKNSEYLSDFTKGLTFEYLDLRVSETCNFGCQHCIAKESNKKRLMHINDAIYYIDEYVKFKKKTNAKFSELNLHFGNCEPLLNYNVIKSCIEYVDEKYSFDLKINYSINTNLSLLNKEIADFLILHNVEIYTSLDGPQKGNDSIRVDSKLRGTYSLITQKMKLLEDLKHPIGGISITITDKNYKYIDNSFWNWCVEKGFISVACDFDLMNSLEISNEDKSRFLVEAWLYFMAKGIEFYGTWMTPFLNLSNNSCSNRSYSFCKAGRGLNISVDAEGNIGACSYSSKSYATFNNLLDSIKPTGEYYNLVSQCLAGQVPYFECKGCILEGSCCGMCQMTRHVTNHKIIKDQCDFYKKVTTEMLKAQASLLIIEGKEEVQ